MIKAAFSLRRKSLAMCFRSAESFSCIGGSLLCIALLLAPRGNRPLETNKATDLNSLASNCSLYASANGKDQNSGKTTASPKTLLGAAAATQPGSVVCVLAGTYSLSSSFTPPVSGTPSAWIVYKNYGDGPVNFVWNGPADGSDMISMESASFPSDPSYLEFRGFNLDGRDNASNGFKCRGSHHLRFIGNTISNTGGGGISTVLCDYLTADRNLVHHNGYRFGWTSGISFNSNQWFDSYPGFHNVISNNIVTGEVDESSKHSDGNGIILDLTNRTYEYESAHTPPALVINNVAYGNEGRCIEAYTVTDFWLVNNTCFKNGLAWTGRTGSITVNNSHDGYVINNISVVWKNIHVCYDEERTTARIQYFSNLCFGSNPVSLSGRSQILQADPLFVRPPYFDPTAKRPYAKTLILSESSKGFMLLPRSPGLRKGIDPSTLPNLREAIVKDLKKYVYSDIVGNSRALGGPFDLGAYQSSRQP